MDNKRPPQKPQIDLISVFKALWEKALSVLLVTLIAGAIAFAYTFLFISPKYTAKAMMYVNNSSFSFGSTNFSISSGELSAANTLVDVYTSILKSRTTMEEVAAEAGVNYDHETLNKMVSTQGVTGGIFSVSVESSGPMEAEKIANTIAKILPDRIAEIVDGASVRIVDYAIVPAHRSSPSYAKNTLTGMLVGFLLSAGFVAMKDIFLTQADNIIRSSDDLRRLYPEIPLLAVIPDMRKASKSGYYSAYYGEGEKKTEKKGRNIKEKEPGKNPGKEAK